MFMYLKEIVWKWQRKHCSSPYSNWHSQEFVRLAILPNNFKVLNRNTLVKISKTDLTPWWFSILISEECKLHWLLRFFTDFSFELFVLHVQATTGTGKWHFDDFQQLLPYIKTYNKFSWYVDFIYKLASTCDHLIR